MTRIWLAILFLLVLVSGVGAENYLNNDVDDTLDVRFFVTLRSVGSQTVNSFGFGPVPTGRTLWQALDSINHTSPIKAAGKVARMVAKLKDINGIYCYDTIPALTPSATSPYSYSGSTSYSIPSTETYFNPQYNSLAGGAPGLRLYNASCLAPWTTERLSGIANAVLHKRHQTDYISTPDPWERFDVFVLKFSYLEWRPTGEDGETWKNARKATMRTLVDSIAAVNGDSGWVAIWDGTPLAWEALNTVDDFNQDTAHAKVVYAYQCWVNDTLLQIEKNKQIYGNYGNIHIISIYRALCDTTVGYERRWCLNESYIDKNAAGEPSHQSHLSALGARTAQNLLLEGMKTITLDVLMKKCMRPVWTTFAPETGQPAWSRTIPELKATADTMIYFGANSAGDAGNPDFFSYMYEQISARLLYGYILYGPYITWTDARGYESPPVWISQYMFANGYSWEDGFFVHPKYRSIISRVVGQVYNDTLLGDTAGTTYALRKTNRIRSYEYGNQSRYLSNQFAGTAFVNGWIDLWKQVSFVDTENSRTWVNELGIYRPVGGVGFTYNTFFDNGIYGNSYSYTRETRVSIKEADMAVPSQVWYINSAGVAINYTAADSATAIPIDNLAQTNDAVYMSLETVGPVLKGQTVTYNELRVVLPSGSTCTAGCTAPTLQRRNASSWFTINAYDHPAHKFAYFSTTGKLIFTWRPQDPATWVKTDASVWSGGAITDNTPRYWFKITGGAGSGSVAYSAKTAKFRVNGYFSECDCPWRSEEDIKTGIWHLPADSIYFKNELDGLRYLTTLGDSAEFWLNGRGYMFKPNSGHYTEVVGPSVRWPENLWRTQTPVGHVAAPENLGAMIFQVGRRMSPIELWAIDTTFALNRDVAPSSIAGRPDPEPMVTYYMSHPDSTNDFGSAINYLQPYFERWGHSAFHRFNMVNMWCGRASYTNFVITDGPPPGLPPIRAVDEFLRRKYDTWWFWCPPDVIPANGLMGPPIKYTTVTISGYTSDIWWRAYPGRGVNPPTYYTVVRPTVPGSFQGDGTVSTLVQHLTSAYDYSFAPGFTFYYMNISGATRQWIGPVNSLQLGVGTGYWIKTTEEPPTSQPLPPASARYDSVCSDCEVPYSQLDQVDMVITNGSETGNTSVVAKWSLSPITDSSGYQVSYAYVANQTVTTRITPSVVEAGRLYGCAWIVKDGVWSPRYVFDRYFDRVIATATWQDLDSGQCDLPTRGEIDSLDLIIKATANTVPEFIYVVASANTTPTDPTDPSRIQLVWKADSTYTVPILITGTEPYTGSIGWWSYDQDENVYSVRNTAQISLGGAQVVNALDSIKWDSVHSDFADNYDTLRVRVWQSVQTGASLLRIVINQYSGTYPDSSGLGTIVIERPYQSGQLFDTTVVIQADEPGWASMAAWGRNTENWSPRSTAAIEFHVPDTDPPVDIHHLLGPSKGKLSDADRANQEPPAP